MKALTVWQPWASLIILRAKPYEFRPKPFTDYIGAPRVGQRIVIHASARPVHPREVMDLLARIAAKQSSLVDKRALPLLQRLAHTPRCRGVVELSAALGTAVIGEPQRVEDVFGGRVTGHDSDRLNKHLWAWPLTDIEPFPEPVPMRGFQGFWDYPAKSEAA